MSNSQGFINKKEALEMLSDFLKTYKVSDSEKLQIQELLETTIKDPTLFSEEGYITREGMAVLLSFVINAIKKKKNQPKPSSSKQFITKQFSNITRDLFGNPLTENDKIPGTTIQTINDELKETITYRKNNIEYYVPKLDFDDILEAKAPKMSVSQDKNIKALLILLKRQCFQDGKHDLLLTSNSSDEDFLTVEFTFAEYAKVRGYTDEDLSRRGKFIEELKRDLRSGALTSYKMEKVKIAGEQGTVYLPGFYAMFEPANKNKSWKISFTPHYKGWIMQSLKGQMEEQFYQYSHKEIADRKTTENPSLHGFYNIFVTLKTDKACTIPIKVSKLLTKMKANQQCLERPKSCYELLKDCILHFGKYYPEEFSQIILLKDPKDATEKKLPISCVSLETIQYKTILDLLKYKKVKDIRDAWIIFEKTN